MSKYKTEGRMIKKDISNSKKFASLCPQSAVLFAMIIPHLNSHGKMNGGPGFIKEVVCPFIDYLSYQNIPDFLKEINDNTNVKWFMVDGRYWIHSINFLKNHQKLDPERLGQDDLPSYSKLGQELVKSNSENGLPEVEVEVEEEVEDIRPSKLDFESVWKQYPNKDGKKKSWAYFKSTVKTPKDLDEIKIALSNYILHLARPENTWKKTKSGSTWFNNWQDWISWIEPGGEMKTQTAVNKFMEIIQNSQNRSWPSMPEEIACVVRKMCLARKIQWPELHDLVCEYKIPIGDIRSEFERLFDEKTPEIKDFKAAASGEK